MSKRTINKRYVVTSKRTITDVWEGTNVDLKEVVKSYHTPPIICPVPSFLLLEKSVLNRNVIQEALHEFLEM